MTAGLLNMPPDSRVTVLVTGATGRLGGFLWRHLALSTEAWGTGRTRPLDGPHRFVTCELTDASAVMSLVSAIRPHVCIHCAALSDPDMCERNPDRCHLINVQATKNICDAARKCSTRVVLCSTDYVFGDEKALYSEDDLTAPLQVYGCTKVIAEKLVLETRGAVVIRLPLLYGASDTDFTAAVDGAIRSGVSLAIESTAQRYPLYIPDIAPVIEQILARHGCQGVFHLSGPEAVTKFEWARWMATLYPERSLEVRFGAHELLRVARRPAAIRLDDRKARRLLSFSPRSLSEGTRAAVRGLGKNKNDAA